MSKSNPYAAKSSSEREQPENVATPEPTSDVPSGTVREVLEWVGDDQDRAEQALAAEKEGAKRSTLISELEDILDDE